MPQTSIIIPHFNGEIILEECLASLGDTISLESSEIIVVDNGSTDNSISMCREKFPYVVVIQSDNNRGYAGGCNFGAQFAQGEFLIFLNNDTIHKNKWIDSLLKKIQSDNKIASVQPKILNYFESDKFDYAGACGGHIDIFGYPFSRGRIFDTTECDNGQYENSDQIFWASGTAFITKKLIFEKVGGFDETLFAHMEEIDYHWRCHLMGYDVWVEPQSVIHHQGGATLAYGSPEKTYLNHRNSFLLLLTNYSFLVSLYLFLPRLFMEFLSLIKYTFSFQFRHSWAQLRALGWILLHPHVIAKRRWKTWRLRKIKDGELIKKMHNLPIVWQYFVKQLKTYSQVREAK